MRRSAFLAAVVFVAAVAGGAGAAHAVYVTTLDTLLPGGANSGGVIAGGLRYSTFGFRHDGTFAVNPADVMVRISDDPAIPEGPPVTIQFRYGVEALAGQNGSTAIDYRIDLLTPLPTMNRAGLRFNGSLPAQGVGVGSASDVLTIATVNGSDLSPGQPASDAATLNVFNDGPGRLADTNTDFLSLNPTLALRLSNEITLSARETGKLDVSVVNNFLTVPEPSAAFIALPTALALPARRRRHVTSGPHQAP